MQRAQEIHIFLRSQKAGSNPVKAIFLGKKMVEDGERDAAKIKKAMTDLINTMPLATIDYVEIVDGMTMQSIDTLKGDILCAIAVNIGGEARLIDNFHYTV